jgi:hypothetical protein
LVRKWSSKSVEARLQEAALALVGLTSAPEDSSPSNGGNDAGAPAEIEKFPREDICKPPPELRQVQQSNTDLVTVHCNVKSVPDEQLSIALPRSYFRACLADIQRFQQGLIPYPRTTWHAFQNVILQAIMIAVNALPGTPRWVAIAIAKGKRMKRKKNPGQPLPTNPIKQEKEVLAPNRAKPILKNVLLSYVGSKSGTVNVDGGSGTPSQTWTHPRWKGLQAVLAIQKPTSTPGKRKGQVAASDGQAPSSPKPKKRGDGCRRVKMPWHSWFRVHRDPDGGRPFEGTSLDDHVTMMVEWSVHILHSSPEKETPELYIWDYDSKYMPLPPSARNGSGGVSMNGIPVGMAHAPYYGAPMVPTTISNPHIGGLGPPPLQMMGGARLHMYPPATSAVGGSDLPPAAYAHGWGMMGASGGVHHVERAHYGMPFAASHAPTMSNGAWMPTHCAPQDHRDAQQPKRRKMQDPGLQSDTPV